jgi:hypothetical protein
MRLIVSFQGSIAPSPPGGIVIAAVRHVKYTEGSPPRLQVAVEEMEVTFDLTGPVYVMNEAGLTIAKFNTVRDA